MPFYALLVLATASINDAIGYFELFKKMQKQKQA